MKIIKGNQTHIDSCLSIARELPEYFMEQAMPVMANDLRGHQLYVAQDGNGPAGAVIGFATVQAKTSLVAEISWMAVKPEYQHGGVGTQLMNQIVSDLKAAGVRLLEVKTLAPTVEYAPYAHTRRFYERRGFIHLETIDPYPEWEPGNPCAIYVKVIQVI